MSKLLPIPAGTVTLRDARRGHSRVVELRPFQLAITTVTMEQAGLQDASPAGQYPYSPVTWFEALQWCNRASDAAGLPRAYRIANNWAYWDLSSDGFRLPTEAEWEFACRAGTTTPTYGPLREVAWTEADGVGSSQPVGTKHPNAFGLHDTLGNVWEWCWDLADPARYGRYRSLRGGGWADPPWSCRASVRRGSAPDAVIEDVGFRPARGAVGEPYAQEAQGWSEAADRERARVSGMIPFGWTPLRDFPAPPH